MTEQSGLDAVHKIQIRVEPAPWWHGIQALICGRNAESGERVFLKDASFGESSPLVDSSATLKLTLEDAQVLMDDLWACGVRPTEGRGGAGALAATEKHLKDMQTLTWRLLDDKLSFRPVTKTECAGKAK